MKKTFLVRLQDGTEHTVEADTFEAKTDVATFFSAGAASSAFAGWLTITEKKPEEA